MGENEVKFVGGLRRAFLKGIERQIRDTIVTVNGIANLNDLPLKERKEIRRARNWAKRQRIKEKGNE